MLMDNEASAGADLMARATSMLTAVGVPVAPTRTGFLVIKGSPQDHVFELRLASFTKGALPPAVSPEGSGIVWVFEEVNEALATRLRAGEVNYLDSRGNALLIDKGLRIDIQGRTSTRLSFTPIPVTWDVERASDRPGGERVSAGAFGWAGVPVVLALMVHPELCRASLREIQAQTPASLGTVQRVVRGLERGGYLETGPEGRVLWGRGMLDRWTEAWLTRMTTRLQGPRFAPGRSLHALSDDERIALGCSISGEAAVDLMGMGLRSVTTLLYTDEQPPASAILGLRLRADPAGSLEIRRPVWSESVHQGIYAPSPVVRADLLALKDPRATQLARELEETDDVLRRLLEV